MGKTKYNLSIGDKFNKLTIVDRVNVYKKDGRGNGYRWVCQCECGKKPKPCTSYDLIKNKVVSCGECSKSDAGDRYRKPGTLNPSKSVWRNYRSAATRRCLPFEIDYEKFLSIVVMPCTYCGDTETSYFNPKNNWENTFRYTGVDRINSEDGYTLENVQPCCKYCNMSKSDRSESDFLDWINRVYETIHKP